MPFRFNPFTDKLDLTETGGGPGSGIQTITGNTGGAVGPNGAGTVFLLGSGALSFDGNPGTNTETGQISGTYGTLLAGQGPGVDAVFQDFLDNNFTFTNLTAAVSRLLTITSTNTTDILVNSGVLINAQFDPGFAFGGFPYIQWQNEGVYTWTANIDPFNGGAWRLAPDGGFQGGTNVVVKTNGTFFIQAGGFVVHGNQPADPTYNMTEVDMAIFRSSFNAQTFVLPGSNQNQGQLFIISDQLGSASNGPITIDGNGQLINGQTTYTFNQPYGAAMVMWTGSRWVVVGGANQAMPFVDVTGTSQQLAVGTGYKADNGSLVTLTLPTVANLGDEIVIMGGGAGGWTIVYTTGQQIIFGNQQTTITSGSLSSTNQYDCVTLRCSTSSTTAPIFQVVNAVGNLTVA